LVSEHTLTSVAIVEENVVVRWKALQKTIAEEKKHHKNGIIGSLTGRGDKKDGQRVGRKSTEVANKCEARRSQSQARAYTVEAPNDKPGRVDPKESSKVLDPGSARRSVDGNARGGAMNRMSSAPITSLEHGEHNHREKLQLPVVAARHQPADTEDLGRPRLGDKGRDKSDPQLASPTSERQPDVRDEGPGRPSADGSDSTRVGSEPTDWVAVRQKAEGLAQERGPAEVVGV
jgi:hypothetical protein